MDDVSNKLVERITHAIGRSDACANPLDAHPGIGWDALWIRNAQIVRMRDVGDETRAHVALRSASFSEVNRSRAELSGVNSVQ